MNKALLSTIMASTIAVLPVFAQVSAQQVPVPKSGVLTIGDVPPAVTVGGWAKGTPLTTFDPKKIYVVEFWATWCGPCMRSIPHLTELANKYGDKISFNGISVWEQQKDDTDTSYIKKVNDFVTKMGDKMAYNVAYDTPTKVMATSWMTAAQQNGIPAAFIVQNDKIAWIGNPLVPTDHMDDALDQMLKGTYDAKATSERIAKAQAVNQGLMAIDSAIQVKDFKKALDLAGQFEKQYPDQAEEVSSIQIYALLHVNPQLADKKIQVIGTKNPGIYLDACGWITSEFKDPKMLHSAISYANKFNAATKNKYAYGYMELGMAQTANKDYKAALTNYEKAEEISKKDPSQGGTQFDTHVEQLITSLKTKMSGQANSAPSGNK